MEPCFSAGTTETQGTQRQAGAEGAVSPVPYNVFRAEDADRSGLGCPPPTLKSTLQSPPASRPPQVQAGVHGEASGVELVGGGFLVDGLLAQVVAAFVLLLHAVHQQQDQEDGKEDAHGATHDQSWRGEAQQVRAAPWASGYPLTSTVGSLTLTRHPHHHTARALHAEVVFEPHSLTYDKGVMGVRKTLGPECKATIPTNTCPSPKPALSKRQVDSPGAAEP